jgi:predicted N-formylglutamate amidohydrolase
LIGPGLLSPGEPPPVTLVNPTGLGKVVLVCDHASNRVPLRLGNLGLGEADLADHIAWDPGAAEVARGLSSRLDAPLVLGGYSRLVIDLNRPLASPESMAPRSAGVTVPGNLDLSPEARAERISALFDPYHQAVDRLLASRAGRPTLLLSIHSFTPVLGPAPRPWHAGVAYGRYRRLADLLLPALRRPGDLCIGDNQPYGMDDAHDYTLPTHGEGRGIPHVMIEMRQDGLRTATDIAGWVERLATAIAALGPGADGLFAGD